ncbi:MAG: hypothetical protein AB1426_12645 [Bacillota bacterium]
MKSLEEIIEALSHVDVEVKCQTCGAGVRFKGKQFTAHCTCGRFIVLTKNFLAQLKEKNHKRQEGDWKPGPPNCGICNDKGFVILTEQRNTVSYDYGYRCLCAAGQARSDLSGWPVVPAEKVSRPLYEQDEIPF